MKRSVSVVIPNYNGAELLRANIPLLLDAIESSDISVEIIVVDDASTDCSVELISNEYPSVVLLRNESNKGFAETINYGIFSAKNDIVMALNSDVAVERDIFSKIAPRFDDPDVFAISPNIIDPKNGRNQAVYKLKPGICWFTDACMQRLDVSQGEEIPLFFASGGSSFYDRQKLWLLGGFDSIYKPFYVEDVDLSYRAWKAGWKCLLEPSATVFHDTGTTIEKYHRRRKIKFLTAKNKVIFLWLNITDRRLIFYYFLFFIPSLIWDILSFRKYKFVGTMMALAKLPELMALRRKRKLLNRLTDVAVIKKVLLQDKAAEWYKWLILKREA